MAVTSRIGTNSVSGAYEMPNSSPLYNSFRLIVKAMTESIADKFPESLPAFQHMFPDDAACARYLEAIRWRSGFACPRSADKPSPFASLRAPVCFGAERSRSALTDGSTPSTPSDRCSAWQSKLRRRLTRSFMTVTGNIPASSLGNKRISTR